MSDRLRVASLLGDNPNRYFLPYEICSLLSIKEASVFYCVKMLRKAGMTIERKRGKGYRHAAK